MPVTGSIKASLNFTQTATVGLASASITPTVAYSVTLAAGTGANQGDKLWTDSRTLTATSENLDLAGVLTDIFGSTLTFARIKGLYIYNPHATATLLVGGAASNAWVAPFGDATDVIKVAPGGCILFAAPLATGYAVTAGTADILKIDAGASTITYQIGLVGASA